MKNLNLTLVDYQLSFSYGYEKFKRNLGGLSADFLLVICKI